MTDEVTRPRYTIGVVARMLGVHPQTLRLYEREGLIGPNRTKGNTRLYSDEDLERMRLIMRLTRDLGVNLAGVEVVLQMRRRMDEMQRAWEELMRWAERQPRPIPGSGDRESSRRSKPIRIKIEKG